MGYTGQLRAEREMPKGSVHASFELEKG